MPLYITLDIQCPECDNTWDSMEDKAQVPDFWTCGECGSGLAHRILSAPVPKKVSYHDGYRRGEGYEALKKIASLRAQRANLAHDKRDEINTEIKNIEIATKGKRNKTE